MKKIILSLGGLTALVTPVAVAVSCGGSGSNSTTAAQVQTEVSVAQNIAKSLESFKTKLNMEGKQTIFTFHETPEVADFSWSLKLSDKIGKDIKTDKIQAILTELQTAFDIPHRPLAEFNFDTPIVGGIKIDDITDAANPLVLNASGLKTASAVPSTMRAKIIGGFAILAIRPDVQTLDTTVSTDQCFTYKELKDAHQETQFKGNNVVKSAKLTSFDDAITKAVKALKAIK